MGLGVEIRCSNQTKFVLFSITDTLEAMDDPPYDTGYYKDPKIQ